MASNQNTGNSSTSHQKHVEAGKQSSGNKDNTAQHKEAGKKGGESRSK